MNNDYEIEYILENKKFNKSLFLPIMKVIALFLFSIIGIGISYFFFYDIISNNKIQENKMLWIFMFFVIILFVISLSIIFNLKNEWDSSINFKEIITRKSKEENYRIIDDNANLVFKMSNIKKEKKKNMLVIYTQISLWTYGDIITILCDENRVLVNSKASNNQIFSYGIQRKNISKIEKLFS